MQNLALMAYTSPEHGGWMQDILTWLIRTRNPERETNFGEAVKDWSTVPTTIESGADAAH